MSENGSRPNELSLENLPIISTEHKNWLGVVQTAENPWKQGNGSARDALRTGETLLNALNSKNRIDQYAVKLKSHVDYQRFKFWRDTIPGINALIRSETGC